MGLLPWLYASAMAVHWLISVRRAVATSFCLDQSCLFLFIPAKQTLKRRTLDGKRLETPLAAQDVAGAPLLSAPEAKLCGSWQLKCLTATALSLWGRRRCPPGDRSQSHQLASTLPANLAPHCCPPTPRRRRGGQAAADTHGA